MSIARGSIDDQLLEVMEKYSTPSPIALTSPHREISIARFALEKQFRAYAIALENLNALLEFQTQETVTHSGPNPQAVATSIFTLINTIEAKSERLIRSAKEVTEILGNAVSIDIDKANLHSLLISLPALLRETVEHTTSNPQLASEISRSLTERLESLMHSVRFSNESLPQQQSTPGITFEQYSQMVESVPT